MTLDEAIKHAEEVAEEKFNNAVSIMDKMKSDIALSNGEECKLCAEEHRQLAEWLKDYKRLREQETRKDEVILTKEEYGELVSSEFDNGYAKGYREALEQEPTTKNDLAVEKIMDEVKREFEKVEIPSTDKLIILAKVQNALYKCVVSNNSLGMIRPKGHWIDKFGGVYRCSVCREIISIDTVEFPNGITYKYCPYCGSHNSVEIEKEE